MFAGVARGCVRLSLEQGIRKYFLLIDAALLSQVPYRMVW